MSPISSGDALADTLRSLWTVDERHPARTTLPVDAASLRDFYPRFTDLVARTPRRLEGSIDPQAIVQGDVIAMGPGSRIEAGAIVHPSCRLVLGANSVVRSGAVLRDEVFAGDECLIGVHCEIARTLLLGPRTLVGHFNFVGDSVLGRDSLLSGYVCVSNTAIGPGRTINVHIAGRKIDSGRTHLGVLLGDGARVAAATMICAGCLILPNVTLPPSVTLHGTITPARRDRLMRSFFATWGETAAD